MIKEVKKILKMSLSRPVPGSLRTLFPKVRDAICKLWQASRAMLPEGRLYFEKVIG